MTEPEARSRGCEIGHCQALRSCFHYCSFHHQRICVEGKTLTDQRCGLGDDRKAEAQPQGGGLLPCRFCSEGVGEVRQTREYVHPGGIETPRPLYAAICDNCGARGPEECSESEAAAIWNAGMSPDLPRATADVDDALHLAICQAVYLMNQGDLHAGHDLLRQTLVDYADKKVPLSRSDIVRQQQRNRGSEVTAMMVSSTPRATGETTVESCLAELREMFPDTLSEIRSRFTSTGETNCSVAVGNYWIDTTGKIFLGPTLADCMAQVRAASRTAGEGEK